MNNECVGMFHRIDRLDMHTDVCACVCACAAGLLTRILCSCEKLYFYDLIQFANLPMNATTNSKANGPAAPVFCVACWARVGVISISICGGWIRLGVSFTKMMKLGF